jgi:hypothetical protein
MKSSEHSDPSESTMLAASWPGREVAMTSLRHSAMNGAFCDELYAWEAKEGVGERTSAAGLLFEVALIETFTSCKSRTTAPERGVCGGEGGHRN